MSEYTDQGLHDAIEDVRSALQPLQDAADAIDWQRPVRERIDAKLAAIERALEELDRVVDEAVDELL